MASLNKKSKLENDDQLAESPMEESDTSDSSDFEDSEDEIKTEEETINIDFEALNPLEDDFHGIRQLLLQLLLKSGIDLSELTDMIIKQNGVGSVLKQCYPETQPVSGANKPKQQETDEDLEQVYGLVTCLNLNEHKEKSSIKQFISYLYNKCSSNKSELSSFLDNSSHRVGWIINERFINIPTQIAVPSFDCLCEEMTGAVKAGRQFDFTHYLMIVKKFKLKSKVNKRRSNRQHDQVVYTNAEEEFFIQECDFQCEFSVSSERDTGDNSKRWDGEQDEQYEPIRLICVFSAEKMSKILQIVKTQLQQS